MTITQTWTALVVAAAASFLQAEPPAQSIADVRVFAVYEPVFSRQDVELLARVHPDFVCRGWFKWHNTPDWQAYAPLAQACLEKGILLQGGITCAALYPGENGIDDATFRDFACGDTQGHPFRYAHFSSGFEWYHLSLYNPKVIETLKREVRLQIDAGAVGIWYDEIEGYYDWNPTEGYDPYACAAFRDWLLRKYCAGLGWSEDDPRWQLQFNIDLAKHGGSMRTFDYLRHLQTTLGKDGKPLADNPPQGNPRGWTTSANPLYREWGYAWNRKAQGTFRFDTVAALFADLLADAGRYAREKYGRTLISTFNHNGTARPGVAFQQPHHGAQPPLRNGRLDGRVSYLSYYENLIADAAEVCPEQPVVFFVDWPGETDRLTAMTRADQTHFFATYIPEAYAAGGEFALPLRGYSYVSANQGTLSYLARMADFYREYAPFLRGSKPAPSQPSAPGRLAVRVRTSASGTAVHIVNHAFSTRDIWPQPHTNLVVTLDWKDPAPTSAFAVSPDFPEQRPVPLTLKDGRLSLDAGTVTCSALVIIPNINALRPLSGRAATGSHILSPTCRALAVAHDGRFTLWLPPECWDGPAGRPQFLEGLETGERLPARDGAAFSAPPAGGFASGLLLDSFGLPARHSELTAVDRRERLSYDATGTQRWHTDAWGRFRIPLAQTVNSQLCACVEPGNTNTFALSSTFTAWRVAAAKTPILSYQRLEGKHPREPHAVTPSSSVGGFWANWPDKERAPGVITLAYDNHLEQSSLRCIFSPAPRVSWSNVNSPAFTVSDANAVELVYAGDGSPRTVNAVLHASQRFYRHPLSLETKDWIRQRIPLGEFRDEKGVPFNSAVLTGNISFQLTPVNLGGTPATLWLQSANLLNDTPVKELWRSDAPFDKVDVDNLRAGHQPLPPPPAIASRQPLVRFTGTSPKLLANWAGKSTAEPNPMVVIERIAPTNQPPFLRVTLPSGDCDWGNANIPLPADMLKGQDGLMLRIRTQPSIETIALALHAMSQGRQEFFNADSEVGEAWTDLFLPWAEFRRDDQSAFHLEQYPSFTLQIRRPSRNLTQDIVVDIEQVDGFTTNR